MVSSIPDLVSMEMPFSTPSASGTEIALAPLPRGAASRLDHATPSSATDMGGSVNLMQTSASSTDVITPDNRQEYIRQGKLLVCVYFFSVSFVSTMNVWGGGGGFIELTLL